MSPDAKPNPIVGVFVDGDSFQYLAREKFGKNFDAKDICKLVRLFTDEPFEVDYYLEIIDKKGQRFARALERGGLRVHVTDLRDRLVQAYRVKSEEVLEREVKTVLPTLKHLILVCGRLDSLGLFIGLFAVAKNMGCRTTLLSFSNKTPKKLGLVTDQFVNVENAWAKRKQAPQIQKGEKGKKRGGKMRMSKKSNIQPDKPRVIVITMREDEYRAILTRVDNKGFFDGNRWSYALGTLRKRSGRDLLIAIARCTEQGPNEAHALTRNAIDDLDPDWIVLTGIGGGIPADEFTLGDVIVALRVHDFSVGAHLEGAPSELSNRGGPMVRKAQKLVANIPALEMNGALTGWDSKEAIRTSRPTIDLSASAFYGSPAWRKKTKMSLERHFQRDPREKPIVTTGAIASSGFLIKDTKTMGLWKRSARDLIAMEMELSGVYSAARQLDKEYPILAIRGISDIVGYKRDPRWTTYACQTAGSFCVALLSNIT